MIVKFRISRHGDVIRTFFENALWHQSKTMLPVAEASVKPVSGKNLNGSGLCPVREFGTSIQTSSGRRGGASSLCGASIQAVRAALEPLIEHRRKQVGDPRLFKIFEGATGYQPSDTVQAWLARFSVGPAVVDSLLGMPLYLLIVGPPEEIPLEFQYLLDAYCMGRPDEAGGRTQVRSANP